MAHWLVNTESNLPGDLGGRIMLAREPSEHDPEANWSYTQLREWLLMADPIKFKPDSIPTEEKFISKLKKENPKFTDKMLEKALTQARLLLYRRAFMIFVDPSRPLPSSDVMKSRILGETPAGERPVMLSDINEATEKVLGLI